MKIYTRTGDRGETGLFGGKRVRKDNVRVEAYGEVDELNSLLGLCSLHLETERQPDLAERIRSIQADLLTVGANLATPRPEDGGREKPHIPPMPEGRVAELERWIDETDGELRPLRNFILPGGTPAAAHLHQARTVCRRAERRIVTLAYEAQIGQELIAYMNRVSDLLFNWARLANQRAGVADLEWTPRGTT